LQSTNLFPFDKIQAMREAEQALGFDARNHIAHFVMCLGSEELGDHARAERECNTTLRLLREDSNVLADRPGIESYMKEQGMRITGAQ
jgi:Tfp pilus assembly protein PilF